MHPEPLKPALVHLARTLGFAACRIAHCTPPPHLPAFDRWLADGMAADMNWLPPSRPLRADPRQLLPDARSVVLLAMNYSGGAPDAQATNPSATQDAAAPIGRFARYAAGPDYHRFIGDRLTQLDAWLRDRGGTQRPFVDSAPVLERDFAAAAGLGWFGKNTMLLDRRLGTWSFIAGLLTTLDLPADPPQTARCGRCTRCLAACPTGALVAPYRLDARRCLSYLTIEHRGPIPVEFRPALGDRIFGCDACLEVCPWNRFAAATRVAATAFAADHRHRRPLRAYLDLDDNAFRRLFADSPVRRAKREGFLRNVCVALGNVGGPADRAALVRAAADPSALIAEHARWALDRIGHPAPRSVLRTSGCSPEPPPAAATQATLSS